MVPTFQRPPGRAGLFLYKLSRRRSPPRVPEGHEVAEALAVPAPAWSRLVDLGSALSDAGRSAEADDIYARGLAVFPGDPTLSIGHALAAHNGQRHAEAIARWERALKHAPGAPICHFCLAADLRAVGEIDAAKARIGEALRRFPGDMGVVSEAARIAEADGLFAEALAHWERAVRRRDVPAEWRRGHAHTLILLGRFDEAETVIAAALAAHPGERLLLAVEAMLASAREDFPRAIELWTAYRRLFPDDGTGWEHLGRAVQGSLLAEPDAAAAPASAPPALLRAPVKVDLVEDEALRRLLLTFESIGDNCEFGSVQRRYGAEPLGLLRWNDVVLDNLLLALGARLDGMGEPAHTELAVLPNGEFIVRDRRWDLWMHTFLFEGQADRAALYDRMCRRVAFLRDKLIADLAAAEKTFVFRSEGLDGARLETLHRTLRGFGRVKLLAVQPAVTDTGFAGQPGEVVRVEADRHVGFLRRLGVADDNQWDIAFDDWVAICRRATPVPLD